LLQERLNNIGVMAGHLQDYAATKVG